jgi:uncharacterized protein YbjT (DUF2867 family)
VKHRIEPIQIEPKPVEPTKENDHAVSDVSAGKVVTAPVLVTGGTGNLGGLVVGRLSAAGHEVRVLSRRNMPPRDGIEFVTGDLESGDGVASAAMGCDVIVHCAGSAKGDEIKAQTLVLAARAAATAHLVNISVVGADRVPVSGRLDRLMFGYFAAKAAAERVIAHSGVPFTTLRATQFHDLVLVTAQQLAKLPVIPAPSGFRFQPVEADEVAERMVELALDSPGGLVADLGGPQAYNQVELLRSYLRARGLRRPIVSVHIPGGAARAIRAGANLAPDRAVGRRTWEEFLVERVGAPSRFGVRSAHRS